VAGDSIGSVALTAAASWFATKRDFASDTKTAQGAVFLFGASLPKLRFDAEAVWRAREAFSEAHAIPFFLL
jgi:hypothetical protein